MCDLCKKRGKPDYFHSDPSCAFKDDGSFNGDNWNCATMNALRDIADAHKMHMRNDDIGSISVAPFDGDAGNGFIVMCYYKDRGRVPTAFVCGDEQDPRPLTLDDAEAAIHFNRGR